VLEIESEPMTKLIENAAYREMILRARFNDDARALMLPFAKGADLDYIGITYYNNETRLVITPADAAANPPVAAVYESDEDYRSRLELKPESYSTAGAPESYEFHARSASGLVKGAKCTSPMPGTSLIYVLSYEGNGVPSQAVLDLVNARLHLPSVKPLSEEVIAQAAEIINYNLVADLYVYRGAVGDLCVSGAQAGLEGYAKAIHKLGEAVTYSGANAAAKVAGVQRVVLNIPETIPVTSGQAPYCTGIVVRIAGVVQ
jgi:phage-related baseplate assembly protein